MQELIFKNHFKALVLVVLGITASCAVTFVRVNPVEVPLPLLILGTLAVFLASCFIFYSRATTAQTVQIVIVGVLINTIILAGMYFANCSLHLSRIIIKPEFIMQVHPLIIGTGFLFSLLVLGVMVRIENIQEGIIEEEPEDSQIPEEYEEQPEQEPQEYSEPYQEQDQVAYEIHKIQPVDEEQQEEGETFEPLEEIELDESMTVKNDQDFIPTNIRLVQNSQHTETEQKGRIGSIGKMLVNNKDIENLIESEEVLSSKTNVITTVSGQKIYERFDELKKEFACIKEMALIDDGGFVLANSFEDKQRVQIAGALVSGAYHTLQNYLSQLELSFPVRIFFETEHTNSFIVKTRDEILFSIWNKEFHHLDYGPMLEIFETEDFSSIDIVPYADLIKVENFAVSDSEGMLVNSFGDSESSELFAEVASAILENLKVFLMNIRLYNLSKVVIFTPQKTITIVKPRDKIVAFLTDVNEYPKVSEELLKMEEI